MRIDQLLVRRQLATTRSQAQRLIADGVEWLQGDAWKRIAKNGDEVPESAQVRLLDDSEARYVSRGGLKLEAALKHLGLSVHRLACLDVGQSTGGFTDCLLQHGARLVVGVDVGQAQLHPQLREDARVLCIEGINARALKASDLLDAMAEHAGSGSPFDTEMQGSNAFVAEFDLIVGDLSFISQTLVLPAVVTLLKAGGTLLTLVKPQFELQPGQVGKGGIVKDASLYPVIEQRLREACAALDLTVTAWFNSPIEGGDGNREFFIAARKQADLAK
ncbi:MAG: TlyA family RNA methyltransferase [Rhodoferax sp.]|nr:TlyA family RNA methyltransferase [Rhodoferax sp.]